MNYLGNVFAVEGAGFFALLALAAVKTTLLLAFVALLCASFRQFSAAARHLLWTLALCAALLLPFLAFIKGLEVPVLPAWVSAAPDSNELTVNNRTGEMLLAKSPQDLQASLEASRDAQKISAFQTNVESLEESALMPLRSDALAQSQKDVSLIGQLINWSLLVWFIGALLLLFRLLLGFVSTNLLARGAGGFKEPELNELFSALLSELNLKGKVSLLQSERIVMPVVCGIFRHRVLFPAGAQEWSEERLKMVLLHELAHVARRDCLTQILAQIACAFYWFNPLVWSAARRARIERERACDDYVLSLGTKASVYAHHLLEIARSMQERSIFQWSQAASVAMARPSQLEGRLVAVLSKENKQRAASRAATAAAIGLMGFLFVSLTIIRPTAINAQKQEILKTASTDERDRTENSLLDSFLSIGSERNDDSDFDKEQPETERGNAAIPTDFGALDKELIAKEIQRQVAEDAQRSAEQQQQQQSIAQTTSPLIEGSASLQPPSELPSDKMDSSQVNIKYQPDSISAFQNASEDFIEEMASVGYTNLSVDELIELKAVGVTAAYVRALRAAGFNNLKVRELINLRALDVTAAYIEGIRNAGYRELSPAQFANMKAVGVTPALISKYRTAGYDNLSVGNLTEFSAHDITTDFINSMNGIGFGKLSPRELIELRVFGVTPDFVRAARDRLGNDLSLRQIIGLKNTGILKDKNKDRE